MYDIENEELTLNYIFKWLVKAHLPTNNKLFSNIANTNNSAFKYS